MTKKQCIIKACQVIRKRVRFDGASIALPTTPFPGDDTKAIREATRINDMKTENPPMANPERPSALPPVTYSAPLDCEGYRKLLSAVQDDEKKQGGFHDYRKTLAWAVARAKHYAEKTGLTPEAILDAWEMKRTHWYMNYYQEANQPSITSDKVRVFETVADLLASIGKTGFRCPNCEAVSKSPYACDSGVKSHGKVCDWKVYGLFGHMGKGVAVFVKEKLTVENLFTPIAWEQNAEVRDPAT